VLIGSLVTLFLAVILFVAFFPSLAMAQQQQTTTTSPSSPPPPTLPFTPFSLQQQEVVPEEEGTGNATVTTTTSPATNDTGTGGVTELTSSSSEPPLIAEIIANATEAYAPATIKLDANITGGASPYSYSWSVPDFGVIDQDRSITQMFFEPGIFGYTLTVTDSRGKTVTDNAQIIIYEPGDVVAPEPGGVAPLEEGIPLPPGRGGDVVAPEPGGAASPEEPIQEPGVPPPTVGEGGDTGRGPQGGVTVGPTEEEPAIVIIPNATSGYVGDRFELHSYQREDIETHGISSSGISIFCLNYVPGSGCIEHEFYEFCDSSDVPPPGYRAKGCFVVWYWTPGTYEITHRDEDSEGRRIAGSTQITVRERLPGGDVVAPEPGGVAPLEEGIPLPTIPEPGGIASPLTNDTGGGAPLPTVPEPEGVAPPEEGVPLTVEIVPNATQVVAPATIEFNSRVTGGTEPYNYQWELLGGRFTPEYFGAQLVLMFQIPGMYSLILNVTDSNSQTASDSLQITVGGLELPPNDIGEAVSPPEGGGVLLPPETGEEGEPLGGGLLPLTPPQSPNDNGEAVSPLEGGGEDTGGGESEPTEEESPEDGGVQEQAP
jgi:PKD repeat protein